MADDDDVSPIRDANLCPVGHAIRANQAIHSLTGA
jgi:hypothetical protein